jgi:hypothetical protein
MLAHSEKWAVKQHKGLFGLSKPSFGTYATIDVEKIDSPIIKKKTKNGSYAGAEISGSGTDIDVSKFVTIEKTKFYKLLLGTSSNTAEAIFGISSVSREKRQTFLGKMLSKKDDDKDAVLDYNRDVPGAIKTGIDSPGWIFFIGNFISGGRQTEASFFPVASIGGGYLKNEQDSFYVQTHSSFAADIILINQKGEHLAGLAFSQKHPDVWIRNDISQPYQQAIATFFAVIIAIKDF